MENQEKNLDIFKLIRIMMSKGQIYGESRKKI